MAYPWLQWQGALLVLALLTSISWLQLLRYVGADDRVTRKC